MSKAALPFFQRPVPLLFSTPSVPFHSMIRGLYEGLFGGRDSVEAGATKTAEGDVAGEAPSAAPTARWWSLDGLSSALFSFTNSDDVATTGHHPSANSGFGVGRREQSARRVDFSAIPADCQGLPVLRVVLRGAKGVGKTTLLKCLTAAGASRNRRGQNPPTKSVNGLVERGVATLSSYVPSREISAATVRWRSNEQDFRSGAPQPPGGDGGSPTSGGSPSPPLSPQTTAAAERQGRRWAGDVALEVWDVVDHGAVPTSAAAGVVGCDGGATASLRRGVAVPSAIPRLPIDASTVNVYERAHAVIVLVDVTREETIRYAGNALQAMPASLPCCLCCNFGDVFFQLPVAGCPSTVSGAVVADDDSVAKTSRAAAIQTVRSLLAVAPAARTAFMLSLLSGGTSLPTANSPGAAPCGIPCSLVMISASAGLGLRALHEFIRIVRDVQYIMDLESALLAAYQGVTASVARLNVQTVSHMTALSASAADPATSRTSCGSPPENHEGGSQPPRRLPAAAGRPSSQRAEGGNLINDEGGEPRVTTGVGSPVGDEVDAAIVAQRVAEGYELCGELNPVTQAHPARRAPGVRRAVGEAPLPAHGAGGDLAAFFGDVSPSGGEDAAAANSPSRGEGERRCIASRLATERLELTARERTMGTHRRLQAASTQIPPTLSDAAAAASVAHPS
mgnify:FL=1